MGVQLVAGWNTVVYGGVNQGIEGAIATIKPYLIIMWVFRGGVWYMYDPADLANSDLTYLYNGDTCSLNMAQAATWDWFAAPVLVPKPKITSVVYPTQASPNTTVTVKVTITNQGAEGWIIPYFGYMPATTWLMIWGDWQWLIAGGSYTWTFTFTMPSQNCNIMCYAVYYDSVTGQNPVGDTSATFTIAVTAIAPQAKSLEVAYVKV